MPTDPNAFDLKLVQDTFAQIVADLSGLHTQWIDQSRDFGDPTTDAIILVSMPSIIPIGYDERVTVDALDIPPIVGQEKQYMYKGNRLITFTIKVENLDPSNGRTAMGQLALLQTKLYWSSTGDRLNAIGMGYVKDENPVDLGLIRDDHSVQAAALDAKISYRFSIRDPAKFGWIETADITGPWGVVPGV